MRVPNQPEPAELAKPAHRNSGLFSDHYLNVTLPRRQDWRELASEAQPVMEELAGVFAAYTPNNNEAQTETELVRPVLRALGHGRSFEVQPALTTPDGTKRPDYVFYKDAASVAANKNRTLNEELRSGYADLATPVREGRTEAARLERRLSDLVNEAYGLTLEEVDLLWSTAPPRMP